MYLTLILTYTLTNSEQHYSGSKCHVRHSREPIINFSLNMEFFLLILTITYIRN